MKHEQCGVAGSIPSADAALQPEQIVLIRASFAILAPMADDVTLLFYRRLFELDPALRALFPDDMAAQGRKFMTMLAIMARSLEALDRLLPDVRNLGRRHVGYGVQDAQYETMREALLWALRQKLGDHWTPELAVAWNTAHTLLATTMIAAAREIRDDASGAESQSA